MIILAVRDAQQTENERLCQEALTWLWVCVPLVAEKFELPRPGAS